MVCDEGTLVGESTLILSEVSQDIFCGDSQGFSSVEDITQLLLDRSYHWKQHLNIFMQCLDMMFGRFVIIFYINFIKSKFRK